MRKIIINCAIAALALGSAAAPAMADSVTVTRERAYDGYDRYGRDRDRVRPGVTISDRGITFGAVRERDRYRDRDRDRCYTRSVTRETDEGTVTKTVRRCD
ncbi:hypothetical protein FHX06_005245 [Rhizobium sp. BK512]|uniref:hypothetical protein n=1 Tax=Rhizobium sp. BK512 TaxID=2587010 RepID=UPI000DDC546A|nr:hypothetical protein [Rhizobium sp. BK512]MBB3563896.1 hypothetical protein [Rhizobium sp. BK512]